MFGAVVAHASDLRVKPALPRSRYEKLDARQRPHYRVLQGEALRVQHEREKLWRSFPDKLAPRGFNGSPSASRRRGWVKPATRARLSPSGEPIPETDVMRIAFIRIDFLNDRGGSESSGDGHFDLSGPDTTAPPIDRAPHNRSFYQAHVEALKRYYEAQSYGHWTIDGEVWPRDQNGAYSISDMADLGPWRFSRDVYPAALEMFRTMLFAADSQSTLRNDRIPWDDYDRIVIIHAGGDLQSDVRQDSKFDIPSFTLGAVDSDRVVFRDSTNRPIDRATIVPETTNQDGYFGALNGVLAHECGHLQFFFDDLYDINDGRPIVGYWSLMDSGNLVGSIVALRDGSEIFATGLLPPSIDPWHRFNFMLGDKLPFPAQAEDGETLALGSSERHPDVRSVRLSTDEYLLLENRHLAPADSVELDQADTSRVVLGPKNPDRFEYDALLPGSGVLVWHIDESVVPHEFFFPCDSSRANLDCGINTNPLKLGVSVIEADGLEDLGDPGSPFILGAPFDPYFHSNNPELSDTSVPNLIPHIGTKTHLKLSFLDEPDTTMHVLVQRAWQLPNWPVGGSFPPGGPLLLAVDADGDRNLDVCWAGGAAGSPFSTALFAVRPDGSGLAGASPIFAALDRDPRPEMAALATGDIGGGGVQLGPSVFAVSTYADGPDTSTAGGRVWLLDHHGAVVPGWPARLPAIVTTPPVIVGEYPSATVYVGCANGRVYALRLDGTIQATSDPPLAGGVVGRLAVRLDPSLAPEGPSGLSRLDRVAAGGANGDVGVFYGPSGLGAADGWPRPVGGGGFDPDFLWLDFGGGSTHDASCANGAVTLVVHHADRLWALCADGVQVPGWGTPGDTIVAGLAAGDPDGDGYPEVITQTTTAKLAYWNLDGHPAPGWPKRGTTETFPTSSPPLAVDLDRGGPCEIVGMNGSGIVAALRLDGKPAAGWPLATGLGAAGAPVIADLDGNGSLELVAPDGGNGLYAYTLPTAPGDPRANPWPMLGGDPGRSASLPSTRTTTPPAASAGPLVGGSLKVYPNPARRTPVSFAYRLTEPTDVEFRILDTSGHEVASFWRKGRQADNLEVWDPGGLPAGLYVARVAFFANGPVRVETVPLGLLR